MTYAGPASGTAPTVTISGNQLEFDNSSALVAPTMVFNTTGTVKPAVTISATILFTDTTAITATTDAILSGTLSGAGGFTKSGAGTLKITQTSASWTGSIGASAGILQIGNNGGFGSLGSGTITLSGSGSLNVARASTSFNLDNTITGSTSGSVNFNLNNSATPTAFAVTLTKANTYTAPTTLQPFSSTSVGTPTLKNGIDNALSTTSAFTINTVSGSTAVMTYDLAGFNQTIASLASGASVTTANGIVTDSGAAKTLTITNSTGSTTYAGLISGAIALTKSGASTQILSGGNSYSGLTTVNGGVLQINNASGLGSTAAGTTVNGSDGSVNFLGTVLDLNGVAVGSGESLTLDSGTTANNRVTLRSLSGTSSSWAAGVVLAGNKIVQLQTGDATAQLAISGSITGPSFAGTLNLRGAGTGTLSGGISLGTFGIQVLDGGIWNINTSGNTWGFTTVGNGALVLGADNALPTSQSAQLGSSTTSGVLKLNGFNQTTVGLTVSGSGTGNKVVCGSSTASTLTLNNSSPNTFAGVLGGSGLNENNFGLTMSGSGTFTLSGTNTYSGNTTINAGTLALIGSAMITNTANIVVASNAVFNVSGLTSTPFTLASALGNQTLSNSAPGAILNGTNNTGSGTVSLVYDGINPGFVQTNGSMNLSAATTFRVTKTGIALPPGVYKIIAAAGTGNIGLVAGTVPTVTVNNGASVATLGIVNSELYLTNGGPSTITYGSTPFIYNGSAQLPTIAFSGSTGLKMTNYVGTTVSFNSVTAPTNAGTYYVSNTVAADANYFGATNTQVFTINPKAASVTADAKSKTYGDDNPVLTAVTNGAVNGDLINVTLATDATKYSAVGQSNITVTAGSNPNYSVLTTNSTLTIGAKAATVTADAKTKVYGTANPALTATVTGTVNSDTLNYTLATDAQQFSSVGISNITVTLGSNPNYTVLATNSTLTIIQASTSVGANSTETPSGYKDAVAFTATLPTDATGSVVFSSINGAFSTNTLSSGSATSLGITNFPRGTNVITVAYLGDGNYLGSSTNLEQIVTNHPPVLAPLNLTRTAGLGLHFTWSELTNQWTDVDGDAVTLTSFNLTTTNSVTAFTNTTMIGYPSSAPNVADQINYTASDSYGALVSGVITIAVNAYVTGTNSIVNITNGNPTTLTAYGVIGFTYITERSTNLTDWASVATNTVSTNGVISVSDHFSDLGGQQPGSAFYRIKWQP